KVFLERIRTCTLMKYAHGLHLSTICPSALSRNLKEASLARRVLQKLAIKRDETRRQEFKNSLQNHFIGDGFECVVLDETSKN
ncbi:uncharacterized protein HD556DRAFT_1198478, partial [Suillus plorans]